MYHELIKYIDNILEKTENKEIKNEITLSRVRIISNYKDYKSGILSKENYDVAEMRVLYGLISTCSENDISVDNLMPKFIDEHLSQENETKHFELLVSIEKELFEEISIILNKYKLTKTLIILFLGIIFFLTLMIKNLGAYLGLIYFISFLVFCILVFEIILFQTDYPQKILNAKITIEKIKLEKTLYTSKAGIYKTIPQAFVLRQFIVQITEILKTYYHG